MADPKRVLFCIRKEDWYDRVTVKILVKDRFSDTRGFVTNIVVTEETSENEFIEVPGFQLSDEDAQGLFNELWDLGFRAQKGSLDADHYGALSSHINDLRTIVFKVLKINE